MRSMHVWVIEEKKLSDCRVISILTIKEIMIILQFDEKMVMVKVLAVGKSKTR